LKYDGGNLKEKLQKFLHATKKIFRKQEALNKDLRAHDYKLYKPYFSSNLCKKILYRSCHYVKYETPSYQPSILPLLTNVMHSLKNADFSNCMHCILE